MSNTKAIVVKFPEELAGMGEDELEGAVAEINRELTALALQRTELLKQRKLLEVVQWVMFPETLPAGYQSVATVVQARLRRARELADGNGKTKSEEYRGIAENVETEERELYPENELSLCCEGRTYKKNGRRHCMECSEPCQWQKKR